MKLSKKCEILLSIIAVLCATYVNMAISNKAFASIAADWNDPVVKKTLLTAMRRCYTTGQIKSSVVTLDSFDKFEQLAPGDGYVALPSGLTKMSSNLISCKNLFIGDKIGSGLSGEFKGLFELIGKPEYNEVMYNPETKIEMLKKLGYYNASQSKNNKCMYFVYGLRNEGDSNLIYSDNICYEGGGVSVYDYGGTGVVNKMAHDVPYFASHGNYVTISDAQAVDNEGHYAGTNIHNVYSYRSAEDFLDELKTTVSTYYGAIGGHYLQRGNGAVTNDYGAADFHTGSTWADSAISSFSNSAYTTIGTLKLNDNEKLTYLVNALKYWIFEDISIDDYQRCDMADRSMFGSYKEIKVDLKNGSASSTCGIDSTISPKNQFIIGYDNNDYFDASGETQFDLDKIIEEINRLVDAGAIANTIDSATNPVEDPCLDSQVADNLGWIICPIMSMARDASEGLYNNFVEPALSIEPKVFSENGNINQGPTHNAWAVFQGFANIGFTILFLVVIFSQLTGIGIDNYGIKKILPKLIIAAVLVNLSYIICVICVDLSNILGNSLQDMFVNIPVNSSKTPYPGVVASFGSTVLTAVPIAAGIIAAWYLITPAILLGLLISAVGLIISLLFLFLLLAGREAAIVVLTVISPLAFLCYMLPNTKNLFDKWLKIWEGLLLVYPIAGLLMGGGNFVSRLLVAINGTEGNIADGSQESSFFTAFAAMMISIVPVFFIPTVLKGAFSALGSIGGKLAGLGSALSGKTTGAIRKSDAYKDTQLRAKELQTNRRAGLGADGKPIDVSKLNKFQRAIRGISLTDRGVGRSRAQQLKDQDAINRANRLATPIGFEAAQIGQAKAVESDELKDYMTYINSMTNNGENQRVLDSLFTSYTKAGQENKMGAVAVARIAGRRKDTADDFLNNHFTQGAFSPDIRNALAKEIATGDNSANFREASPLGFEYASRLNSDTPPKEDYQNWANRRENIHDALDHYVTNSKQLVGLKGRALNELYEKAKSGVMAEADIQTLSDLAQETMNNRSTTGVWDNTKADTIKALAELRHPAGSPTPTPTPPPNSGETQIRRRGPGRRYGRNRR